MASGSRFIAAAVAALFVSVASAGFLAARRTHSRPPAASAVAAEPTPAATPSPVTAPEPVASAEPVASPQVEPADQPASAPAHRPENVVSKAAAPKPTVRTVTEVRTPAPVVAPVPAREVAPARPATSTVQVQPAPAPALEPVVESPASRPSPPAALEKTKPTVDAVPEPRPAAAVETAPVEVPRRQVEIPKVQFEEHTVNADSVLGIRLDQSLSSATAKLEDRVTASVSRNVIVDGRTVLPTGTRLEGEVTLVQPGSKFKGRARLGIRFHTLVLADGLRVPIQTETLYRDGESATGSTATKVGGGAAAGAILGGMLGGKRGAIIGAGVGAAGGTAAVMTSDTKEALLERGTPLTMRLTSPVTLTIERDPSSR